MSETEAAALVARLSSIRYDTPSRVAFLVGKPHPGVHVLRDEVDVLAGFGFDGDHPKKSFWRGRVVPGREVTAVALEVLVSMGLAPDIPGDNLITSGIDLAALRRGDRLVSGTVVLERSEAAHRPCLLFRDRAGHIAYAAALEGYRGALFRVVRSGRLEIGGAFEIVRSPEMYPEPESK